jgi:hypothetical protein
MCACYLNLIKTRKDYPGGIWSMKKCKSQIAPASGFPVAPNAPIRQFSIWDRIIGRTVWESYPACLAFIQHHLRMFWHNNASNIIMNLVKFG